VARLKAIRSLGLIQQPIGSKEQDAQRATYYQHVNERAASKRRASWSNARGLKWSAGVFVAVRSATSVILEGNINAMSTKYEDNFGFYCIDDDDPEELEFFCHIRAQSEPTICARCNQKVRLLEHVKICATCSQALEYGAPSDPAWVVPNLWSVVRRGVRS
jgi:hypothetical protein